MAQDAPKRRFLSLIFLVTEKTVNTITLFMMVQGKKTNHCKLLLPCKFICLLITVLFKSGYNDVHAAPALSRLGKSLKGAI